MDDKSLKELKDLNRRLTSLLDDPQPGLFTWCESFSDVCYQIGMYCGKDIIMKK